MRKKAKVKSAKGRKKRATSRRKTAKRRTKPKGGSKPAKRAVSKLKQKSLAKSSGKARPRLTVKRIDEYESAEKIIGRARIREGRTVLGGTRWLTPTKKGFAALKKVIKRVSKPKDFTLYSYSLHISFTGKNGKPVNIRRNGQGIPKYNHKRFLANNRKLKRKGMKALSRSEYFAAVVFTKIRKKIYGSIAEVWGQYPDKAARAKMTANQAEKRLREVKKRNARFVFILNRES